MEENKKKIINSRKISDFDLETRLMASYMLLEFRNLSSETEANVAAIYEVVKDLNAKAQSFEDEKALDLAIKYDTEQVKSPEDVRMYMTAKKKEGLYRMGFIPLSRGDNENVLLSPEGLIGTLLEQGNNQSFEISHKLLNHELEDGDVRRLHEMINQKAKTIKEKLAEDLKTYWDSKTSNPRIEKYISAMETLVFPHGRVEKIPFSVGKSAESKIFRKKVRQSYNQKVKPDFLRLMGTIFYSGKMVAKQRQIIGNALGVGQREKIMGLLREQYGTEAEKVFDQAFSVKDGDIREEVFNHKAEEMYAKMVAGLLVQKAKTLHESRQHFDKTRVQEFLRAIDMNYINKLRNGENDIFCLGFNNEVADNSSASYADQMRQRREMIDDTAEDQIVSIHHKISVGSSEDLVKKLYLGNVDKVAKADEIVNHLANMCFVIGKKTHRELEPKDEIVIGVNPDSLAMAVEIDRKELQEIKNYLPSEMKELIEKYVGFERGNNEQVLGVAMSFPEPDNAVHRVRQDLKPRQNITLKERFKLHFGEEK